MDRSVKSASRVFALLEAFEQTKRPLRVAEIVAALDIPQSSVSMLLKTLVAEGYVDFDAAERTYCPSVRVAYLCEWVTQVPFRNTGIRMALGTLAANTGESALLARISGLQMQYVNVVYSRQALRFAPSAGTRRPLHRTAAGIMLLTTLAEDRIRRLLERYNAGPAPTGAAANVAATLRHVRTAAEQGYFQSDGSVTPGAGALAVLLPAAIRGQRFAIAVGAPLDRLHRHHARYLECLRQAAES